jgi:hypothetical protein
MENRHDTLALHFKYCTFIAAMVIVFMVTDRWSDKEGFTEYLSNAATMTSLLLGVVAIFYSYISNDGMSRSLGSISTVTNEVRDVRNDIKSFSELTEESTKNAQLNNSLVKEASTELSKTMSSLAETLVAISSQNDSLKNLVSNLPIRIDQLESKFGEVAKAIGEQPQQKMPSSTINISEGVVQRFLARTSFQQHLIVAAVVFSNKTSKPLNISDLCIAIDWDAPSFIKGFLGCMHAATLCTRKLVPNTKEIFTINSINENLVKLTKSSYLNYVDTNFPENQEEKDLYKAKLIAVEAMFYSAGSI